MSGYERPIMVLEELDKKYGYMLKGDADSFFEIAFNELDKRCTGWWSDSPTLRMWVVNKIIELRETKKERLKYKRSRERVGCITLGEILVFNWLKANGWYPRRTIAKNNIGIPDFECSKNRWVEAKNISYGHFNIALCQINYWKKLFSQKNKVFLVLYDSKKEIVCTPPLDIGITTLLDVAELVDTARKANIER